MSLTLYLVVSKILQVNTDTATILLISAYMIWNYYCTQCYIYMLMHAATESKLHHI